MFNPALGVVTHSKDTVFVLTNGMDRYCPLYLIVGVELKLTVPVNVPPDAGTYAEPAVIVPEFKYTGVVEPPTVELLAVTVPELTYTGFVLSPTVAPAVGNVTELLFRCVKK